MNGPQGGSLVALLIPEPASFPSSWEQLTAVFTLVPSPQLSACSEESSCH